MAESKPAREIRIGTRTGRRTIDNILNAFGENEDERLVLRSVGGAMSNAIIVSEIVRRRCSGLHSIMHLDRAVFAGDESSAEEGEHPVDRKVPMMIITLTKQPTEEDLAAEGHQDPVDPSRLRNRADDFASGAAAPQGRRARSLSFTQEDVPSSADVHIQVTAVPQGQGRANLRTNANAPSGGGAPTGRRRGRFSRGRGGRIAQPAVVTA
jgi:DNA-binding protein